MQGGQQKISTYLEKKKQVALNIGHMGEEVRDSDKKVDEGPQEEDDGIFADVLNRERKEGEQSDDNVILSDRDHFSENGSSEKIISASEDGSSDARAKEISYVEVKGPERTNENNE